jgi:5-methylcytosine-specific restriction endonuclease McrA
MDERTCTRCGNRKVSKDFYPNRAQCKACVRARVNAYAAANREAVRARQRTGYAKRTKLPDWRHEESTRISAYRRTDRGQRAWAVWYVANADKARLRTRLWAIDNPDRARINAQASVRARRARQRSVTTVQIPGLLLLAKIAYWGDRCWICKGSWSEIDHVKPLSRGGAHILANLRPICRRCNAQKNAKWPLANLRRSA